MTSPAETGRRRLSCCIITFNEEANIARCLRVARQIADDLVVVDSGSSDRTVEIARSEGARVIHNPWPGYGQQKRFAEDQCRFDWVLNLDADEALSPTLIAEIAEVLRDPRFCAYRFKIRTVYPGRARPRLFADYHHYVRLYDRREVRFKDHAVHDTVDTRGLPVGDLQGDAWHFSFRSLEHLREKVEAYTTAQGKALTKPVWVLRLRAPGEYLGAMIKYYLFRRHITGGLFGLKVAHVVAQGRALRIRKMLAQALERRRADGGERAQPT